MSEEVTNAQVKTDLIELVKAYKTIWTVFIANF
jgi:hypothetical protein